MTAAPVDRLAAGATTAMRRKRRSLGMRSPQRFAQVYLPHHFGLPASPMHAELFGLLAEASGTRHAHLAVAAPRGHAKSTVVTLAFLLWGVLSGREPYTLVVSATAEQARQLLKHARDELETNARIAEDFPKLGMRDRRRRPSPWRGNRLQLPTGALLHAIGAGQQIRGARHQQHRPSLIICDDLETAEHVASEEQRIGMRGWFERTLLKAGDDRTNVVVVGTVLHYDALLARLLDHVQSPGWMTRRYRALLSEPEDAERWARWEAIYTAREEWGSEELQGEEDDVSADSAVSATAQLRRTGPAAARRYYEAHRDAMDAGAAVLWPEKDPLYALMEMRLREGRASFDAEKQNEPLDPDQCLFRPGDMRWWDDEFSTVEALLASFGATPRIYLAWDPSVGRDPRKGDYSAIVGMARHPRTKACHVIIADIARRSPQDAINRILEYARLYRPHRVVIESNGFQEILARDLRDAARRAHLSFTVKEQKNTGDKRGRIELLEPAVRQGLILFSRRHRELNEQLRQFPLAAHDDGPDALQMCYEALQAPVAGMQWGRGPRIEFGG